MGIWTVDFISRTGDAYQVIIEGGSHSGTIALTPSADPFVTQEEGDADLFVPVRCQTGYINIETDDVSVVRGIIPSAGGVRKVYLYRGVSQVWRGYVQPQVLKFRMWNGPQEVGIPIECPLSALKYRTFGYFSTRTVTIGEVLGAILHPEFNNVRMQGAMLFPSGSDYSRAWLWKRINTSLLKKEGRTDFDALEDICSLFGWTARSVADTVACTFYRNLRANITDLYRTSTDTLLEQGTYKTAVNWSSQTIPDGAAVGNDSRISLYEGVKNAVVTCQTDVFDTEIDSPESNQIALAVDNGTLASTLHEREWVESGEGLYEKYWEAFPSGGGEVQIGDWYLSGFNVSFSLDKHGTTNIDEWEVGMNIQSTTKRAGNPGGPYTDVVEVFDGRLQLRHTADTTFTAGYLKIVGADYTDVRIWIGNRVFDYANGRWATDPTNVAPMPVSKRAIIGQGGMTGAVKVELYNIDTMDLGTVRKISQIKVQFTQLDADDYIPDTEIRHEASVGASFTGTKELTTNLCVYEPFLQRSENEILNPNLTLCAGLYDTPSSGATFNPLQRVADEAAAELSEPIELVELNIRREELSNDINPMSDIYIDSLGANYYPVSIGRRWREDLLQVKFVKR